MADHEPALAPLLREAEALRVAGRLAESAEALRQAVARAPRHARLLHDYGMTLLTLGRLEGALHQFDRAAAADPDLAAAHLGRGMVLDALDRKGAEAAYARAIELRPEEPQAWSLLADLMQRRGTRLEAAPLFRRAAALAPGTLPALIDEGRAALIDGDYDTAEQRFLAARAMAPAIPLRAALATIRSARGDFAGARAEIEQAIAEDPGEVSYYYDFVQTRRITPADAPLIDKMRAVRRARAPIAARIRLHLALAKAADDLEDAATARAELEIADGLRARDSAFDAAALHDQSAAIKRLFTPAYLAHAGHRGSAAAVPILVVGMPRSGTTLMEQILARHPSVGGAGEVRFWDAQGPAFLAGAPADTGADLRTVADAYLAKLRESADAAHVVDKLPFNLRWSPLVHLAFPNARIVHMRRHAADTALSILLTNMPPTLRFSTVRAELRAVFRDYYAMADFVRGLLPADRFMEVDYEALVADPEPAIRRVLAFCGLAWDPACLRPDQGDNTVMTYSKWQVRQPINAKSAGRRARYGNWLEDFTALMPAGG